VLAPVVPCVCEVEYEPTGKGKLELVACKVLHPNVSIGRLKWRLKRSRLWIGKLVGVHRVVHVAWLLFRFAVWHYLFLRTAMARWVEKQL